ncbi:mechanosensitive ion channel family protein [Cyanobium sp. CH-040]|uniref:mechanosensitive ion channel family protein n=1 Tax=Cyanobium sp. CH-040 TaxID=2823708 RepID=UPI0020CCAC47|nr:mechanosensitive ion channel domain-containing protein [Cyanobium sp. CH-040]MCP9928690.1 mechanosensitive ion channel [Cyanobium sp. CH-040]
MPDPTTPLPFDLQLPLTGLALSLISLLVINLVARRLRRGGMVRGLLLAARLSVTVTILLCTLGWWLGSLLSPALIALDRDGREIRDLLLVLGVAWTLLRWKGEISAHSSGYAAQLLPALDEKERIFLLDVLTKLIGITALVVLALEVMRLLGVSAAVLVTAGGFGAAAVGFGAREIVSNSLSGLMLYINRPFVVGDTIEIPNESLTGSVENIGWFYTQLRSLERQPIFVPNTIFSANPVTNIAETDKRRIWIEFGLSYDDRPCIEPIVADLERALAQHPGVDQDKTRAVNFTGYGESSLDLRLLCHATSGDVLDGWALRQDLLLRIGEVVAAHGAAMPFPTRTLIQAPGGPGRP